MTDSIATMPANLDFHPHRMTTPFTNLCRLIPRHLQFGYTSPQEAANLLQEVEKSHPQGTYVIFDDVTPSDLEPIGRALRQTVRNSRFTYEEASEALIIRLMPGLAREMASRSLSSVILSHVWTLPGHGPWPVTPVGSARYEVPGQRSKEADEGFIPSTRQFGEFPSVVIEGLQVGMSESLSALRLDAAWWLVHSNGATRMVIILRVKKGPCSWRIEQWEMVTSRFTRRTASSPASTNCIEIDEDGTVTPANGQLVIPYLTMFDQPHVAGADIGLNLTEVYLIYSFAQQLGMDEIKFIQATSLRVTGTRDGCRAFDIYGGTARNPYGWACNLLLRAKARDGPVGDGVGDGDGDGDGGGGGGGGGGGDGGWRGGRRGNENENRNETREEG
ncbi:hypothetical protein DFH27DRAFT_653920 [Peziza echinospora]|nr:hypothetical protein DFH27DRAFT_653920 [Peziza echinospora]